MTYSTIEPAVMTAPMRTKSWNVKFSLHLAADGVALAFHFQNTPGARGKGEEYREIVKRIHGRRQNGADVALAFQRR